MSALHKFNECLEYLENTFSSSGHNSIVADIGIDPTAARHRLARILCSLHTICNSATHTMRLPPEILSTIFRMVQENGHIKDEDVGSDADEDDHTYENGGIFASLATDLKWMRVRLVCRHWRTVSDADPTLWSTIILGLDALASDMTLLPEAEEYVNLSLLRSQRVMLNVSIGFPETPLTFPLFSAILSHIHRIQRLDIVWSLKPDWYLRCFPGYSTASRVKALSIDFTSRHDDSMLLEIIPLSYLSAPVLQSLSIRRWRNSMSCGFHNLKQLRLSADGFHGSQQGLLELLHNCSSTLEDLMFCSEFPRNLDNPSQTSPTVLRHISLPKLKKLAFIMNTGPGHNIDNFCSTLLPQLDLPLGVFIYSDIVHPRTNTNAVSNRIIDDRQLLADTQGVYICSFDNGGAGSVGITGNSYACTFARVSDLSEFLSNIHKVWDSAREIWLDHRCQRCDFLDALSLASASNVTKLYTYNTDAPHFLGLCEPHEAAGNPLSVRFPHLREIHFLLADLAMFDQDAPSIQKLLRIRKKLGHPVKTTFFYLSSVWNHCPRDVEEENKFERSVVSLRAYTQVEVVHTGEWPAIEVPEHCRSQSGGLWNWPVWDDNFIELPFWNWNYAD